MDLSLISSGKEVRLTLRLKETEGAGDYVDEAYGIIIKDQIDSCYIVIDSKQFRKLDTEVNGEVGVFFVSSKKAYTFAGKIIDKRPYDSSKEVLKIKAEGEIKESQRREFFRIDCFKVIQYSMHSDGYKMQPKEATVVDLSGSGMKILLNEKLIKNKKIICEISLDGELLNLKAEIVWFREGGKSRKYLYEMGVRFIDYSDIDREKIIKYIFKEQLRIRNQELNRED